MKNRLSWIRGSKNCVSGGPHVCDLQIHDALTLKKRSFLNFCLEGLAS